MQWDLGIQGLGVLVATSIGFGLIAHLILRKKSGWVWVIAAAAFFAVGLIVSEVWFGWATEQELQPNIDGLSFDEVLLAALISLVAVGVIRYWTHRKATRQSGPGEAERKAVGSNQEDLG
jgi:hypothetical protein